MDIKPDVLIKISVIVGPFAAHYYNLVMSESFYPGVLQIGRVTPAFKSGKAMKMNNFRPILNCLAINKAFELLAYKRMIEFIDQLHILSDFQHGF